MTPHSAVIEAGPGAIRRLCCGASEINEETAAALDAIDDPVALVADRPVAVDSLWLAALRSLADGHRGVVVVYPSWWWTARIDVISSAAKTLDDHKVTVRPRSWLLNPAESTVLVEIGARLVAVIGDEMVAVPRRADPHAVAAEVLAVIAAMAHSGVLVDAPHMIAGAPLLATLIADGCAARVIDEAGLKRLSRVAASNPGQRGEPVAPPRSRTRAAARLVATRLVATWLVATGLAATGVVAAARDVAAPTVAAERPHRAPVPVSAATTVLVEGRVALTVPANWTSQRVTAGPGSARVQVTSPSDPEVALHVTQSSTPGETLAGVADRLKRAIDAEPVGVFVDFNPAGVSGGRPAVSYREVRAAHEVRWTVLLDGSVRISVGCQSRLAAPDPVRDACDQAVRTAHAAG